MKTTVTLEKTKNLKNNYSITFQYIIMWDEDNNLIITKNRYFYHGLYYISMYNNYVSKGVNIGKFDKIMYNYGKKYAMTICSELLAKNGYYIKTVAKASENKDIKLCDITF